MARNLGAVQRRLAPRLRVIALDLRNHGASPHDPAMSYPAMAADVRETLAARGALPAAFVGHSMGGKVAMRVALERPDDVARLLVADIAPVRYPSHFGAIVAALRALPLRPGMTRADADAALRGAVPEASMRAFLLQNLRLDPTPAWRIGLDAIAAALPEIEGWPEAGGRTYPGPALFVSGARSDYVQADARPAIRALFPAARFVTLKDAGHWLHADNPEAFGGIVEAFVGG